MLPILVVSIEDLIMFTNCTPNAGTTVYHSKLLFCLYYQTVENMNIA